MCAKQGLTMDETRLVIPPELLAVPQDVLKEFLSEFAQRVLTEVAPNISDDACHAAFSAVYAGITIGGAPISSTSLRLELRHACKFSGCSSRGCELCRNNPHKVCDHAYCLDQQYWVRDDGKGGQLIKAKCGADVELQLFRGIDPQPLLQPDVKVKLYVTNGQLPAAPTLLDPPGGFYLSDDGRPLFFANGMSPEDDGGLPLELVQDGPLGPGWVVPELQFLDKNSKFRVQGRTVKSFRFLARAVARDPVTGLDTVLAQVESEPFKVTTKKGYDGCRKAEHLFAHEAVTDKTFANLGETTINNLKATFMGVETVEDLKQLVERAASDPDLEEQVREVLNMSRDKDRWRKFSRTLRDKVLYEDSAPRLWWLPAAMAPPVAPGMGGMGFVPPGGVGLLWQTHKGQLDFATPTGVVTQLPGPGAPLRVAHITGASQAVAGPQLAQLQQLAVHTWRLRRHPGWRPVREDLEWVNADPQQLLSAAVRALAGYPEPLTRLVAGQSSSSSHPFSSGSGSSAASQDHNSSMAAAAWGPAAAAAAAGDGGRSLSVVVPQLPPLVSSRGSGGPVSPFMTSTPPADLGWPTTSMPPRPPIMPALAAGRGSVVGPVWGGLPGTGPPPLPVPGVPFQGAAGPRGAGQGVVAPVPGAGRGRPSPTAPAAAAPGAGGRPSRSMRSATPPTRQQQQQQGLADQAWQQPVAPTSSPLVSAGGSQRESPFSRPRVGMPGVAPMGPRSPLPQQQQQQQGGPVVGMSGQTMPMLQSNHHLQQQQQQQLQFNNHLLGGAAGMGAGGSWVPVSGGLTGPVPLANNQQHMQMALPHAAGPPAWQGAAGAAAGMPQHLLGQPAAGPSGSPHTLQQQQQQQQQQQGLGAGTNSVSPAGPPAAAAPGGDLGFLGAAGQAAALAAIDAAVASCPREVPAAVLRVRQALQQRWPVAQMHELLRSFSDADLALLLDIIKGAHQQQQLQQLPAQGMGADVVMLPVDANVASAPPQLAVSAEGPWPTAGQQQQQQQGGVMPAAAAPHMGAAAVNAILGDMLATPQPPGSVPLAAAGAVAGGGSDSQRLMEMLQQMSSFSSQGAPVGVLDSFGGNLAALPDLVADLTHLPGDGQQFMDWIPDLDKTDHHQQHQQQQQAVAGAMPALGTKRERSTTAAGDARQQPAQSQGVFGLQHLLGGPGSFLGDDEDLLLLRDSSSGSFGRHLPTARLRSGTQDVTQRPTATAAGSPLDKARPSPQAAAPPLGNIPEEGPAAPGTAAHATAAAAAAASSAALAGGLGGVALGGAFPGVPVDGTASDPLMAGLVELDPAADLTKATLGALGDIPASARSICRGTGVGAWGLDALGVGSPGQDDLSLLFAPSNANLGDLHTPLASVDSLQRSSSSGHLGWISRLWRRGGSTSSAGNSRSGSGSKQGVAGSGGSGASAGRSPSTWLPGKPLE